MFTGHFYYINDQYFKDFPDEKLMSNKDISQGKVHDRPCFYAFEDTKTGIFWLIPISSQVEKYKAIYDKKVVKYKRCDTLFFAEVLGYQKAFLLQNMCPVLQKYIKNEYCNKSGETVRISFAVEKELIKRAKRVLAMQRKGIKLIFPDVIRLEKLLLQIKDKTDAVNELYGSIPNNISLEKPKIIE